MRKIIVSIFITSLFLAISPPAYSEKYSRETIHLSAGDQLILEEIKKVNERIDKVNERIATEMGNVNERIDFLWATMVGGFLGVMIFVGGIVFWDRRTTLAPVHDKITELSQREKVMEDVLKDFAKDEPRLMERLRIAGLL